MAIRCHRRSSACLLAAALLAAVAPASAQAASRRFALFIANNDGGAGTHPLRYAKEDAEKVRNVLTRLGDLAEQDALLLYEQSADQVRGALARLEPRLRQAAESGQRPILFVFYSGHAKDGALRLGSSSLPLEELKTRMAATSAEVRIGLFDSCRSGATRTKGARKAPAFEVDSGLLQGVRGLVILASSAADEDSQESDELSGSFFSHHFASGLMGGADSSGDGKVSLAEAYAYAYSRTVADTAETAAGAQHPTFAYDLAGNGDVILTDFAARTEGVLLAADAPEGSWFVVDSRGAVAAEVSKSPGIERRIALGPGRYRIKRRLPDRLRVGELSVPAGQTVVLNDQMLRDAPFSDDPVKGAVTRRFQPESHFGMALGGGYQRFFEGPFPSTGLIGLELGLRGYLRENWLLGFDLAFGGGNASVLPGGQLPYRFSEWDLGVSIGREWPVGLLSPFLGARLAMIGLSRRFTGDPIPDQVYAAMTPGLLGGLQLRLSSHLTATARARLHYLFYNVDSRQSLGYLEGALLLGYEL